MRRARRLLAAAATAFLLGGGAAGCGSGSSTGDSADVLYAGSLVALMEHDVGPAFDRSGGYRFVGYSGGSTQLAREIAGGVRRGDVFVSANPAADTLLMHGGPVRWYAEFATSPLVLGYRQGSPLAHALATEPWWQALATPGARVGRTDPRLDPKGALTERALDWARSAHGAALAASTHVFPEEELVGRVGAGQLDAGFFYASEARQQGLATVPLTGVDLHAAYTVTVLADARHPDAGAAFVRFLLGSPGRRLLTARGFTVVAPGLHGDASAVPAALRPVLARR